MITEKLKFLIITLGCKVNQYDTQSVADLLLSRGHIRVKSGDVADVCIVNTCAVTADGARKSRHAVKRLKKLYPNAKIAVCGCLPELTGESVSELKADLIGGSKNRTEFVSRLESMFKLASETDATRLSVLPFKNVTAFEDIPPSTVSARTRALLKIQDGCDCFCAYCIVPFLRGPSRSLTPSRVLEHAKTLANHGHREIIITGIEISSYGKDLECKTDIIHLMKQLGNAVPEVRLRLGSLEPSIITEEFCEELKSVKKLCRHFHLSMQSACDKTLQKMGRKYSVSELKQSIELLKSGFPNCAVTADLIVGFPGETEFDFDETMMFIKTAAFADMHVFKYSRRPGTAAEKMPAQVSSKEIARRARLASLQAIAMKENFLDSHIGEALEVLFESYNAGYSVGYSDNYIEIAVEDEIPKHTIIKVMPLRRDGERLICNVI